MIVVCPHCHLSFSVQTRAPLGSGTQQGKKVKINNNRQAILNIIKESGSHTVRQIQAILHKRKIQRESKKGTKWNYHTVQADLSVLVGGGHLKMTKDKAVLNLDTGEYDTKKIITYSLP